jgi:hypothetical protein
VVPSHTPAAAIDVRQGDHSGSWKSLTAIGSQQVLNELFVVGPIGIENSQAFRAGYGG